MTANTSARLDQLAFIIPLRIDTADRLWNLSTILRFIAGRLPGAEVLLIEQDATSRLDDLLAQHPEVRHLLIAESGPFRKTDCVNHGALNTTRRFVCMYDTDVMLDPAAILIGLHALTAGGWRLVLPYNRICLDLSGPMRTRLGQSLDLAGFDRVRRMPNADGQPNVAARFVDGGIFIADRETFLAEGGLNKKMVSYGWEDTELHKRFLKLGYPILHLQDFNLIHLDHSRGPDSVPNQHYDVNRQEFEKVDRMSRSELARYVETDLSLTARGQPQRLAALRAAQRRHNRLGLLKLQALWALLSIHVRAYGLKALAGRLAKR